VQHTTAARLLTAKYIAHEQYLWFCTSGRDIFWAVCDPCEARTLPYRHPDWCPDQYADCRRSIPDFITVVDAITRLVYGRFLDICGYWVVPPCAVILFHTGIDGPGRRNGCIHASRNLADLCCLDRNDPTGRKHDGPDCDRHPGDHVWCDVIDMDTWYRHHGSCVSRWCLRPLPL